MDDSIKKGKQNIEELFEKLISFLSQDIQKGKLATIVNRLLFSKEYTLYLIMKTLLIKFRQTGILKSYKKGELLEIFKWKKTQLNHYLQQGVNQNFLLYHERQYSLNLNNTLIKRIWDYQFTPNNVEDYGMSELTAITSLFLKGGTLKEQISQLKKSKLDNNKSSNNIVKYFIKEINSILTDDSDCKAVLMKFCFEHISLLID